MNIIESNTGLKGDEYFSYNEFNYFSLHHRVQNGSGAHLASYLMDTRGFFPGGKAAGA
jgi:hypothetical protein